MVSEYRKYILLTSVLIAEYLLSNFCCGALVKTCPSGVCKSGNCTAGANAGHKIHCSCYNVGSGEVCDPKVDANNCKVLQCVNGLCKLDRERRYYCECIAGWGSADCNMTVQVDVNGDHQNAKRKAICPTGSYMCPSGECSKRFVTNCDGTRDCVDGSDEACNDNGSYYKNPEDIRYQRNNVEKDVRSTNTGGRVDDYTGILLMVGIVGFISLAFLLCRKLLKMDTQRIPNMFAAERRSYLGGLHDSQLQDEEHLSRRSALRETEAIGQANTVTRCDCTAASPCNCPRMQSNHRFTLEARIPLIDIFYREERVSNFSDTPANLDPPPVYADIVSERVSFVHRCETPPPAYEDLVFRHDF